MLTHPGTLPRLVYERLIAGISAVAVAALVLAIAALSWTRYHWDQQQRMTREEV